MSKRLPVTPAPGPLEAFASAFDELFSKRNQRELFRRYLEGLLLPSERIDGLGEYRAGSRLGASRGAEIAVVLI